MPSNSVISSCSRTAAIAAAGVVLSGCTSGILYGSSPGANEREGELAVRNVHLESPPGEEPYPVGADVHLYLWLYNDGSPTSLVEVSSPVASSASMTRNELPVAVPEDKLTAFGPQTDHFVLENITAEVAGYEYVPLELVFANGQVIELRAQAIEVDESDSSSASPLTHD